ncbi:hypothetical protein CPB83DRAFT_862292 [Crepidotus variabilis]|uniref:FAD synthase n=1 Tax=Crepidotus variabilis TaxID=179855 RepID=A0A9P6E774_9AGAR|nr:hypothetical protein CPB83DRAFT_862292 [Crepidotus variabilis]
MWDPARIAKEVYDLAAVGPSDPLSPLVKEALDVIDSCLDDHGACNVSFSFNGGKDCTVLLHLYAGALARRRLPSKSRSSPSPFTMPPIHALYIPVPSPFIALEEFIENSTREYNLDLFSCRTSNPAVESVATPAATASPPPMNGSAPKDYLTTKVINAAASRQDAPRAVGKAKGGEGMRQALEMYTERFPNITAILIGTRRGDPHGAKLSHRNPTDAGWPVFERVNPIINWTYTDVWSFLRRLEVPYCSLYDEGYTSLGSTFNTFPNPALLLEPSIESVANGAPSKPRYRHAHELQDGSLERCGRGNAVSQPSSQLQAS